MRGMVFAAGLGTRLRPLTDVLPKPAVPLLGRPLASYSLERLAALGIRDVAINTHHLAAAVERELAPHVPSRMRALFVHEPELLGTGGGLRNAMAALGGADDEPIVVMNGDIVFWPDLEGALALHERLGAMATMVLRADGRARQFGAVEIDAEGRVRRLLGRPEQVAAPLRELMFTGVHVLSPRALRDLPAEGCIIRRTYRRWIDEGEIVAGFVDESAWRDLGTPSEYLRANLDLLRGELRWPGIEPRSSWVAPDAVVGEDVVLHECVVGRGALLEPRIELERVLVWPGTRVGASAADCILAPHATVHA